MSKATDSPPEQCLEDYKYLFQPDLLKGKVAFVTGGGTGIGFTITEILMRHGCRTIIASRRLEVLQRAAATLTKATGQECLPIQMDVRDPKKILAAVQQAMDKFGRIDILINNAAGNFLSPAESLSFNAFRTVMDIDAIGTFNVTKAVFDASMKKHGGVIVSITATLQVRGQVFQVHAGTAKAAIEAMTRHLAVEWGEKGIRLMCVAPGPISDTEGWRRLGGRTMSKEFEKSIPIQRMGKREDIANTVLYIVSGAGELLTGTTIIADGGRTMSKEYEKSIPIQRVGKREDIANTVLYIVSGAGELLTGTTIIADGGAWLTSENSLQRIRKIMELHSKM